MSRSSRSAVSWRKSWATTSRSKCWYLSAQVPKRSNRRPGQFIGLNRAEMIFNVGLIDFETTLLSKIEERGKVVNLSQGIELIAGSCSHACTHAEQETSGGHGTSHAETHNHSHAHGVDPHVWTSPRALQKMAQNAYAAIRRAYPDSVKYETNYKRLQADLRALDAAPARRSRRAASNTSSSTTPPSPITQGITASGRWRSKRRQGTFGQAADAGHPSGP